MKQIRCIPFGSVFPVIFISGLLAGCLKFEPERVNKIVTGTVSEIGYTTCVAEGNLLDIAADGADQHGFCYSKTPDPALENGLRIELGPRRSTGTFSGNISELERGTTYYIRAFVVSKGEVVYGEEKSFLTLTTTFAEVQTNPITNISVTTASGGGSVTDEGGTPVTARGVCWSETPDPDLTDPHSIDGGGAGSFSSVLIDLSPGTNYYVRAYATNSSGTAYGQSMEFRTEEGVVDMDGNVYPAVMIGSQVWMARNLMTTRYADGSAIPNVTGNSNWDALSSTDKAYCWYDDNPDNGEVYGALYTWAAAMNGAPSSNEIPSGVQGVCPDGWHLPSDSEWKLLEMNLGMTQAQADATGMRGNDEGGKLKEAGMVHWASPNTGATNSSGFTARPSGGRYIDGTFVKLGTDAYFWTAAESDFTMAWGRFIYHDHAEIFRYDGDKDSGIAVRCLKD